MIEAGEKVISNSAPEGQDTTRKEMRDIKMKWETFFEDVTASQRKLEVALLQLVSFEDKSTQIEKWLSKIESRLEGPSPLTPTLKEKKLQLQNYKVLSNDVQSYKYVIDSVGGNMSSFMETASQPNLAESISRMKKRYKKISDKLQKCQEKYTSIVTDHQEYNDEYNNCVEWLASIKEKLTLCDDVTGDKHAIQYRLDKIMDILATMEEGDPKVTNVIKLSEKVLPATAESGKEAIIRERDALKNDWSAFVSTVAEVKIDLENCKSQWEIFEAKYENCSLLVKQLENKIKGSELKKDFADKEEHLKMLKSQLKEMNKQRDSMEDLSEVAQNLSRMTSNPHISSKVAQLKSKHQVAISNITDYCRKWEGYVSDHQKHIDHYKDCQEWISQMKEKIKSCQEPKGNKISIQDKLHEVQGLMAKRDDGQYKLQTAMDSLQMILPHTAVSGRQSLQKDLQTLQTDYDDLSTQMSSISSVLEDCLSHWLIFDNEFGQLQQWLTGLENQVEAESKLQATPQEKKLSLERVMSVKLKLDSQKSTVNNFMSNTKRLHQMTKDDHLLAESKNIKKRYEKLVKSVQKVKEKCEMQVTHAQTYRQSYIDAAEWLTFTRQLVSDNDEINGDKPLLEVQLNHIQEAIENIQEGEEKIKDTCSKGEIVMKESSENGQKSIRDELDTLKSDLEDLKSEVDQHQTKTNKLMKQWKEHENCYDQLCKWMSDAEGTVKTHLQTKCHLADIDKQVAVTKKLLGEMNSKQKIIEELNQKAQQLQSVPSPKISSQVAQINATHSTLLNTTKDLTKRIEKLSADCKQFDKAYDSAKSWISSTTKKVSECSSASGDKALIQKQLTKLHELVVSKEEGQLLTHKAITAGEPLKVSVSPQSREVLQQKLDSCQQEWDLLVSSMSEAKVLLESNLLQWSDFTDSSNQVQKWMANMEKRLKEDKQAKVDLIEMKAYLQKMKNTYQDIVSHAPIIESAVKQGQQLNMSSDEATVDVSQISNQYCSLKEKAQAQLTEAETQVGQYQNFHDSCEHFRTWLKSAKDNLTICADINGDRSSIAIKSNRLKNQIEESKDGKQLFEQTTASSHVILPNMAPVGKSKCQRELKNLKQDYDDYRNQLNAVDIRLQNCTCLWNQFEANVQTFDSFLKEIEGTLREDIQPKANLDEKKQLLTSFQEYCDKVSSHQSNLDILSGQAQELLQICNEAGVSYTMTQLTTRFQTVINKIKDCVKNLEQSHYQHEVYDKCESEFTSWLDDAVNKLNVVSDTSGVKDTILQRLATISELQVSKDNGHLRLQKLTEAAEKVMPNTNNTGSQRLRQNCDTCKTNYDSFLSNMAQIKQKQENALANWEQFEEARDHMTCRLQECESRLNQCPSAKSDLAEKKSSLEGFKVIHQELASHKNNLKKLEAKSKRVNDESPKKSVSEIKKLYESLFCKSQEIVKHLEDNVKTYTDYRQTYLSCLEWLSNTKRRLQQIDNVSGDLHVIQERCAMLKEFNSSLPTGEQLVEKCSQLAECVSRNTAPLGCTIIKQELSALQDEWKALTMAVDESEANLQRSLSTWTNFENEYEKFIVWFDDVERKSKELPDRRDNLSDKIKQLKEAEILLEEMKRQKETLEKIQDLGDKAGTKSNDPRISHRLLKLTSQYHGLNTSLKNIILKLKENVTEHETFDSNYKTVMDWIDNCEKQLFTLNTTTDDLSVQEKLKTLNIIVNEMDENVYKVNKVSDSAEKIHADTSPNGFKSVEEKIAEMSSRWSRLNDSVTDCAFNLQNSQQKWQDYESLKESLETWLVEIKNLLSINPEICDQLSEKKTQLDKYKVILSDINSKQKPITDLGRSLTQLDTLSADNANAKDSYTDTKSHYEAVKKQCQDIINALEVGYQEHDEFQSMQHHLEQWLLEMANKLAAQNVIDLSTLELTEQHVQENQLMLENIMKHAKMFDDVEKKGENIIAGNRGAPKLAENTRAQVKHLKEGYSNLLTSANKNKDNLAISLEHWRKYRMELEEGQKFLAEDLPSWKSEMSSYHPDNLQEAKEQLSKVKDMWEKLNSLRQNFNSLFAHCQPAADAKSSALFALSEDVNHNLIGEMNQVENRLDALRDEIQSWEMIDKLKNDLRTTLRNKKEEIQTLEQTPPRLPETAAEIEIAKLKALKNDIDEKKSSLQDLSDRYLKLTQHNPQLSDTMIDAVREDWEELQSYIGNVLDEKEQGRKTRKAFQDQQNEIDEDLARYAQELEKIELEGSSEIQRDRITKLSSKLSRSKKKIENVKGRQPDIVKNLGSYDSKIIDDQIRDAEKQSKKLTTRVEKLVSAGSATDQNIQDFDVKTDVILSFFEATCKRIAGQDDNVTYQVSDAQDRLAELKNLEDDVKKEETTITQLNEQGSDLLSSFAPDSTAHQQLKTGLATIFTKYSELLENVSASQNKWNQRLNARKVLQKDTEEVSRWLQNKESDLERFLAFGMTKPDVERQKKNSQKIVRDNEGFHAQLKDLLKKGGEVGEDCSPESKAELLHQLSVLESRYGAIKKQARTNSKDLGSHLDLLCKFQSKSNKLKTWCNETEMKCSTPLHLDCATAILRDQHAEYQKLHLKSKEHCEQLPTLQDQSEKLQMKMSDDDKEKLDQQIKLLDERTTRIYHLICDRLDQLESVLSQQDEVDGDVQSLSRWLESVEKQVTPLKSIGNSVHDAKKLQEDYQKLSSEFQTKQVAVAKLQESVVKLTDSGQTSNLDTTQRILTKFSLLNDQVVQMLEKCLSAVSIREQYSTRMVELQSKLDQCRQRIDKTKNVPDAEKLEQYKDTYYDLQEIERSLNLIVETACQIDLESPNGNGNSLSAELKNLQAKINSLKSSIDQETQECERKDLEGKEISKSLDEMLQWLELRHTEFTTFETLDFNLDKLKYTFQKQQQLFQELVKRVKMVKTGSEQSQKVMGDDLKKKLVIFENLHEKTKRAYEKKEKYINDAIADRNELETSIKHVNDWVNGAEKLLECRSVDDSDHQNLQNQLEEIKEYLSEASLCQDEMEIITDTASRMVPSLDETDKITLEKSVNNIKGRQESVMTALQDLQDKMEARIDQWHEFHGLLQDFETIMPELRSQWSELINGLLFTDPNQILQSRKKIEEFVKCLDHNKPLVDKINKYSRELDIPRSDKESFDHLSVTSVNDQWNYMKIQTQEKLKTLADISDHWECVNTVITEMDVVLKKAEQGLLSESFTVDPTADDDALDGQIERIEQIITENLSPASAGLVSLKESADTLLKRLPTAEAKVHSQDQILLLNERYERLAGQCQEYLTLLLEEKKDRNSTIQEIEQTMDFLEDGQVRLYNLANSSQDGKETDVIGRQKKIKVELDTRLNYLYSLIKLRESKYGNVGTLLPENIVLKLESLKTMQKNLQKLMAEQETMLQHIGKDRQAYKQLMDEITAWLIEADLKLKTRIKDVGEDIPKHKELLVEFDSLKSKLANVRTVGEQLIHSSPDSIERQKVQHALASLNKRHAALQASVSIKTQQLEETQVLLKHFNEDADSLERWLDQAEEKTRDEIDWNDLNAIKQQFHVYKELSSKLPEVQIQTNHLNSKVKHLKQICDVDKPLVRVSAITPRLFNLNGKVDHLSSSLGDANVRISSFESHLMSLNEFLIQTKQNQQLSEPNLTIQDRLLLHKKMLDDIERQKTKTDNLMKQLPSQMLKTGFQHPEYVILIEELHSCAEEHQRWLLDAFKQEETNKMEIQQLKHDQLNQTFPTGSDPNLLRYDFAENAAVFNQLKHNRERLEKLEEKNRQLSKMAIDRQSVIYGQYFPIQSHGEPQISTSTPEKKILKDSGVSFSTDFDNYPFLSDTLSEISQSPSNLVVSNSFDELDKTVCQPIEYSSNQSKVYNQTQSKRTKMLFQTRGSPSFYGRGVKFPRSSDWYRNQRLGVRRQLFNLTSQAATSDIGLMSKSLPDISGSLRQNYSDRPSAKFVIRQNRFKLPNLVNPELIPRISSKLHFVHNRLTMQAPVTHFDVEHYVKEYTDLTQELSKIKSELNSICDLEKSTSADPQKSQAMTSTLSLLSQRVQQAEAKADDRYKILQEIVTQKEEHFQALKEYVKTFDAMKKWLQEKQQQLHSSQSLIGKQLSVESLLQEIEKNKKLQDSVHQKMKELSDMAVQCDSVCEFEPSDSAEDYRNKLVGLQKNLSTLKLNIVKNLNSLSQALKEAEAKQRAPSEFERDRKSIEEWLNVNKLDETDNKDNYFEEFKTSSPKSNDKQKKKLDSEFSAHMELFQTITTTMVQRPSETNIEPGGFISKPSDDTSQGIPWKSLHSRLLRSKQLLLDRSQTKPLALHFASARYLYNNGDGMKDEKSLTHMRHAEQSLANLNDCWNKNQNLPAKDPRVLAVNEELKKLLLTLSEWLDHFETCIFMVPPKNNIQQKLAENEMIRHSINDYQEKMKKSLAPICEKLNQTLSENDRALMNDSLSQVKDRILLLMSQLEIHASDMNTWKRYEEKMTKLKNDVNNISNKCNTRDSEESFSAVIEQMENIERQLKELEINLSKFKSIDDDLDLSIPNWVASDFTNLQMAFMDAKGQVVDKKANYFKASSTHSQYEKILKDFAEFLMVAENKLKTKKIVVRDFDQLKQQLKAHKEFFSEMEKYRGLLDSLVKGCTENVRKQHEPEHARLGDLTNHVQDLANFHGQYLNSYVNRWSEFNAHYDEIMLKIKEMDKKCNSLSSDLDNGGNLSVARDNLKDCQEMHEKLTPEVFQVLNQGKAIQCDINSLALNAQVISLAERWSSLHSFTCDLFERLEEVYKQIEQYKNNAAIWSTWLESNKINLATLRNLQEDDVQNISVIRSKMEKLLEVRKLISSEADVKNKLVLVANRLQESHPSVAERMDINVDRIEEQWAEFKHDIDRAEQALHQAQMELLPSRQALNELIMFLDKLNKTLERDVKKSINNMNKLTSMLNKYKKFKLEMENKELMMEFVNQSILKPNEKDDSASSLEEKNDFAKRLSKLQQDWAKAEENLDDQLNRLSAFQEQWEEFEQFHKNLANWFLEMEEKMKKRDVIGSEVTVKHIIKECQMLREKAVAKEADIEKLKTLGNEVLEFKLAPTGTQKIVKERVETMQKKWQTVCKNLQQQEDHLQEVLKKWVKFSSEKALILDLLDKLEYYLSCRANFTPGNYHLLQMHLSKMKVQSEEIEKESNKLETLAKLSTELSQVCDSPIKHDLDKTTRNIQNRWKTLTNQLKEHCELLEGLMNRWKVYNEKYQSFCEELSLMEKSSEDMMFNYNNGQMEKYSTEIQDLHDQLDTFQSKLSELYQLSEDMGPQLDTLSVMNINFELASLEDRLLQLRHSADRFHRELTDIRLQFETFEQSLKKINSVLERSENVIQNTNIQQVQSVSAEEAVHRETLMKFKELLVELHVNATLLDSLNELGYRMALDEDKVQRMQELNQRWNKVYSSVVEHCQCLQNNVLLHQNFTEKCASWMTHLAEMENLLAEDIGGSFEKLLDQQKKYQTLTSELANKQLLLHAIIVDGQRMQTAGDATDSDFEHKLVLLSTQWQNVTKRISDRKTMVDTLISTWKNFNDQFITFDRWLEDKHTTLRGLDIDMASMRCKRNIMEKLKNIENEFKMQDERYNSILDVSQKLLQYTSNESNVDLVSRLKELQYKRTSVIRALDLQMSKLQTAVKQWELCDEQVEELLAWLKDMHHISWKSLPTSYEELEAQQHRCQDLQVSCSIYEDKYQEVFESVNQLNHLIQPEDVSLLQQRMKLWHKQWTDLCVQLEIRIMQIKDSLGMWPQYITDVQSFCIWCEQMEAKVRSMNGHNIETMLAKFENEYERDIKEKEKIKDNLKERAETLQARSSKVRSSDIAIRVTQVENKWQHLQTIVSTRKHKLKQTLQAMQQFDRDTANLRKWLEEMENKLHAPPVYVECDYKEIEKHMQYQKDLQKDIERHSAGVSSVLNLCEVLLHDSDACRTDKEAAALSNTKNNLEKRWKEICKLSTERETSIQETWKLWQSFMTDNSKFTTWLDETEKDLQKPDDSFKSKNCQHRFYQDLQRKISEKVSQLENLKKQYDVLVNGGRTDTKGSLERKVREANNRWEELSRKANVICKTTTKNAVSWDEYHVLHKTLLKWLRNVDSRIKEFEKADNIPGKDACLKKIQEEQMSNHSKFSRFKYVSDQLLIDKDDTQDSRLQIEVDEFYDLHDWVIGRLNSLLLPDDQYPNEPLAEVEQDDYTEIETYLKSSPPVSPQRQRSYKTKYAAADIQYSVDKDKWRLQLKEELSPTNKENLDAYNEEMLNVLEDCAHKLIMAEEALRCRTPIGPELDYETSNYIKIMSDCQASVENVHRVYTKIKDDLGLKTIRTMEQEVSNVTNRWTRLRSCIIEKDLKMQNNRKDWSQFNTDLDNTNKWLSAQENWLKSINVSNLEIAQMGGIIKELKDFQEEVKSKQPIVESLRLTGVVFCEGPLKENQLAKSRLDTMNKKWKQVTARCEHLVGELRKKLSQSDYFHEEVERLLVWMNHMEAKVQEHQPHNIDENENNVQWQYDSLQSLGNEIKQQQTHISALKETSRHLQGETISHRVTKSKDDIHIISAKAHNLHRQIMTCLAILESRLDFKRKPLIYGDVSRSGPSSSPIRSPAAIAVSDTTHINDENTDDVDGNSQAATGVIGIGQVDHSASSKDSCAILKPATLIATNPEVENVVTSSVDVERKPPTPKQRKQKTVPPEKKGNHIVKDSAELLTTHEETQGTVNVEVKPPNRRRRKTKSASAEQKGGVVGKDDIEPVVAVGAKQGTLVNEESEKDKLCDISDEDEVDAAAAGPCSCSSFCRRAFWVALPIQALLLLLLGLASLLPMTEEDYSCALTNNMQRSFTSVLQYMDGPPPV